MSHLTLFMICVLWVCLVAFPALILPIWQCWPELVRLVGLPQRIF